MISIIEAQQILMQIHAETAEDALSEFEKIAKIKGIDGALNDVVNMEKQHYLDQHPFEIYFSQSENRYRSYLPPKEDGGKRRPIAAKSKTNLENKIIAYYQSLEVQKPDTLERLYPIFLEYKGKETTLSNARKLQWVWETYYEGEDITKQKLCHITVASIKTWLLDKIEEYSLTNRKYKEMKSVLNMMFDYAVEDNLCSLNPARMVGRMSRSKFVKERKKDITEQVYISFASCALHMMKNSLPKALYLLSKSSMRWLIESAAPAVSSILMQNLSQSGSKSESCVLPQ